MDKHYSIKDIAPIYKYTIWKHWQQLTRAEQRNAKIVLPEKLNIKWRTFENWMYIRESCNKTISAHNLYMLSTFFNVPIEQMWTTPPKKLTKIKKELCLK